MSGAFTQEKILDAAELLFAENGISSTSVRAITSQAGVNLASLNYHFGSKSALVDAVYERRLEPLNKERISLLNAVEARASSAPSLEEILECLVGPPLRLAYTPERGGREFMRLMARGYTEPGDFFERHILHHFSQVIRRFSQAFQRVLPEVPGEQLHWKLHFVIGAMAHTMGCAVVELMSLDSPNKHPDLKDPGSHPPQPLAVETIIERLVEFSAAGIRARDETGVTEAGEA